MEASLPWIFSAWAMADSTVSLGSNPICETREGWAGADFSLDPWEPSQQWNRRRMGLLPLRFSPIPFTLGVAGGATPVPEETGPLSKGIEDPSGGKTSCLSPRLPAASPG